MNQEKKLSYSPAEFAALFSKSPTWGYRRIYAGAVQVLKNAPSLLIPQAEVDKFMCTTAFHGEARKDYSRRKGGRMSRKSKSVS